MTWIRGEMKLSSCQLKPGKKMTMENVLAILEDNFRACFGVLERLKQLFGEL